MRQTSIISWKKLQPELGERQTQVLKALTVPMSNRELSITLHLPINQVTPRTNELVKKKLVIPNRTKQDFATNRKVIEWRKNG